MAMKQPFVLEVTLQFLNGLSVTFNTNSSIATNNRTICSLGVAFQSSEVCTNNDKLIIYVSPGFVSMQKGVIRFRFIDDSLPYPFNINYG